MNQEGSGSTLTGRPVQSLATIWHIWFSSDHQYPYLILPLAKPSASTSAQKPLFKSYWYDSSRPFKMFQRHHQIRGNSSPHLLAAQNKTSIWSSVGNLPTSPPYERKPLPPSSIIPLRNWRMIRNVFDFRDPGAENRGIDRPKRVSSQEVL